MSSELKLKVVFDSSGAQAAADALPDAVDRANRKGGKKPWEGPGGASAAEYKKMAGMEREIKAQQLKDQQKAAQEAARKAAAEQRAQGKTEAETEAWHRKDLARRLKEIGQKNEEAERATKAEEARKKKEQQQADARYKQQLKWNSGVQQDEQSRKEKEEKQANAAYVKRLKWNSKLLEEQQKAGEAAKAGDWTENFGKALEETLMSTIAPAAIAAKAIELGWGTVIDRIKFLYSIGEAKLESGIQFTSTRGLEMFGKAGTLESEDAIAMARKAQTQANALATGGSGADAYGFQYFGMTDYQKYRQEGVDMVELIIAMAKKYKSEGGSEAYRQAAESVVGPDWRKLSGLLYMQANPEKAKEALKGFAPGTWKGTAMDSIEQAGGYLQQKAVAKSLMFGAMQARQGELMGGISGSPSQMLSNVTSLQAMGGGDILSAIARGPQDQIVDNTARTATAVEQMANRNGSTAQPAIIGR
jgi:hypothetical protein